MIFIWDTLVSIQIYKIEYTICINVNTKINTESSLNSGGGMSMKSVGEFGYEYISTAERIKHGTNPKGIFSINKLSSLISIKLDIQRTGSDHVFVIQLYSSVCAQVY